MSSQYKTEMYIRKDIRRTEFRQRDHGVWSASIPAFDLAATGGSEEDGVQHFLDSHRQMSRCALSGIMGSLQACRIVLAVFAAFLGCGAITAAPGTIAAVSSTWYPQNSLSRAYSMQAISCPSVIECVTVGQRGSITTTTDGGRRWTSRRTGVTADLLIVACPSRLVCYALGSTQGNFSIIDVLLKSVDGGATWSAPSPNVSLGGVEWAGGSALICPSMSTCLLSTTVKGTFQILRTADGGKTWQGARGDVAQGTGPVVCPTTTTCYAGQQHMVYRSVDAGATWNLWSTVRGNASGFITGLACPRVDACIVVLAVCLHCGDDAIVQPMSRVDRGSKQWTDLFLVRDGKDWRHVARGGRDDANSIVCGSARRCYALGVPDLIETANGGKTWSSRASPLSIVSSTATTQVSCPGPTTCYAAAGDTAVKTTDGFRHIRLTPTRIVR